jgi:hypothetical protein
MSTALPVSATNSASSPWTARPCHYPAKVGLPLLRESRLNHFGKLAFQQLYRQSLLPGRDLPGISAAMPRRGKNGLPAST